MSATTAGAIKAVVEAAGLRLAVYRGRAPEGTPLPYVTVQEGIGRAVLESGDVGDPGADLDVRELAQVDLWQARLGTDGGRTEDYALPNSLVRALHGASLPNAPGRVYRTRVVDFVRLSPGPGVTDDNLVRDTLTVALIRAVT